MASLAEIIEEGERQLGNYQTMILPHGDARALLAVAKAAVECEKDPWGGGFTALRAAVRGDAGKGGANG